MTQRDSIEMVTLADALYVHTGLVEPERVASFSPSGSQFIVVLRRGDIDANTNVYSMLLWNVSGIAHGSSPRRLLEFRSRSNQGNINDLRWRDDHSVTFLGSNGEEAQQLYRLDTRTGALEQLTHHSTDVLSYSLDAAGTRIAYLATRAPSSLWNETSSRNGIVVSTQYVEDLMTAEAGNAYRGRQAETDAFLQTEGNVRAMRFLRDLPEVFAGSSRGAVSISPDGRYVIAATVVPIAAVPQSWRAFTHIGVRHAFQTFIDRRQFLGMGQPGPDWSFLQSYELFDVEGDASRVLIDAPLDVSAMHPPHWSEDGARVFLAGVVGSETRTVEVEMASGRSSALPAACARVLSWNARSEEAACGVSLTRISAIEKKIADFAMDPAATTASVSNASRPEGVPERYLQLRKRGAAWIETPVVRPPTPSCRVELRQSMNDSPKLYFACAKGKARLLMDLNPQLTDVALARVEEITWEWAPHQRISGGLYLPPDRARAGRLPLIIQTHGWDPHAFWVDGFSTTGYAAQALAARGFAVLQLMETFIPPEFGEDGQSQEVERAIAIYQGAVEYLDRKGVIDRARVGIVGFSHTNFYVQYALAHHPELFAVAAIGEGEGGGYLEFITRRNAYVDAQSIYGGPPIGEHLPKWMALAPAFNAHQVMAPVRIVANHPRFLLINWEWFEALTLQDKPVDFVLLRDGEHVLGRPDERLVSQQGNVEWFDFWLNGRRSADASRQEQYDRWQRLCDAQLARYPARPMGCRPGLP